MARARELRLPTAEEYRAHGTPPFGHLRAEAFTPETIDDEAHAVEGYVSTDGWKRDGQRIVPQAWAARLDTYRANPIVTWAHEWWEIPIGLATDLRIDDRGLWARLEFDAEDEMIARVWRAIVTKRVRTTSVSWDGEMLWSFQPRLGDENEFGAWVEKPDGNLGWEWRANIGLMETAVVPIPADTDAVFALARSMGLTVSPTSPLAGDALEEDRVMDDLRRLSGAAESLRNYYRHVAKDGGAPSPDVIEQAVSPITDLVEIAAGREREGKVLSAANLEKVTAALEALQALVASAGGATEEGEDEGEAGRSNEPGRSQRDDEPPRSFEELVANINEERAAAALRAVGMEAP